MSYRQGKTKPLHGIQVNWGHPLSRGLIGCWNLSEGSGSATCDVTGKRGFATLNGTGGVLPTWASSQVGRVLSFSSADAQYVEIPHHAGYSLANGRLTFQMKFRMNSLRNWNALLTKTVGASQSPLDLYIDNGGNIRAFFGDTSQTIGTAAAGVWYDLIFSQDGVGSSGRARAWLNGQLIFDTTLAGVSLAPDAGVIRIGSRGDGVTLMDGQFEYARIWDRPLSATDATLLQAEPYAFMSGSRIIQLAGGVNVPPPGRAYYYAMSQGLW